MCKYILLFFICPYFLFSQIYELKEDILLSINCLNEIDKAYNDANSNKYLLPSSEINLKNGRSRSLIIQNLKKYNIRIVDTLYKKTYDSILKPQNMKDTNCYLEVMTYIVKKKFSNAFFEKIIHLSDSSYVVNHKDEIFFANEIDNYHFYKKSKNISDQVNDIQRDLDDYIKYPNNFIFKDNNRYSYTTIDFIIDKNNKIIIKSIETQFENTINYKLKKYFENRILKFIKRNLWNNGTLYGIKLNTYLQISYQYK